MPKLALKEAYLRYKKLYQEIKEQNIILKKGLAGYKNIIIWYIPLMLTLFLFIVSYFINLSLRTILNNILLIMPSLIGFLIASLAIIISINTSRLKEKPKNINYSYKRIGSSMFFHATILSFILLFVAFLTPKNFPIALIGYKSYIIHIIELAILFIFSKFIVMILYGLIYLSSSIEE